MRQLGKWGAPDLAHLQQALNTQMGLCGVIKHREYPFITELVSRIAKPGEKRMRLAGLYMLIEELAEASRGLTPLVLRPSRRFSRLEPAINAVSNALERGETPTVSDLARECGITEAPFWRAFRLALGQSPQEYILACRMRKAQQLLLLSDMSVTQAAFEVGYQDVSGFNRQFLRTFDMPPSAYKQFGA